MTRSTLLIKNLTRNRLRTFLTVIAIALPMFVFMASRSLVDGMHQVLRNSDKQMRIAVHQKLTFTQYLPQRIRDEILQIAPPGAITAICRTSWFGGKIPNEQYTFPNMAVDRDAFPIVYSEFEMSPEEIERFQSERRGAVVSKPVAQRLNLKVGDRLTLKGGIPPYPEIELLVAAIPRNLEAPWVYFALDYYNEVYEATAGIPVGVNNFWIKCATPAAQDWALNEIDKHFANSENETRTERESTFLAAFAKSGGDWVSMVGTIGLAIVAVAVAVAFNTMSMAFRERTREIAVLRAIGFRGRQLMFMLLCEGVLLGLMGGALAVLPLYLATQLGEIRIPGFPVRLLVPHETAIASGIIAFAVGFLAALTPAVLAGRLHVASALRKVA